MPYRDRPAAQSAATVGAPWQDASSDWRKGLPILCGDQVTLRELRLTDAPSLFALLTTEEVTRFISPPPTTVEGFERFVLWTHKQRSEGRYVCFGVVPDGCEHAVGLVQVRQLDPTFANSEWGFCLGSGFWGTGIFQEAARMAVDFSVDTLGVHRLEARACAVNARGNGALRKLGAVQEGVLRKSFFRHGLYFDQVLWTILDEDWRLMRTGWRPKVH